MATQKFWAYKNEDVNNPEFATIDEVKAAFMRGALFVKYDGWIYTIDRFNETTKTISTRDFICELAYPPQ